MTDGAPIRLLVVNGCEHTAARAADDCHRWPEHLAEQLGVPLLNMASAQSSNHRIVRTTVRWLPVEVDRRGVQPHQVAFVAMFAHPDRTEVGTDAPSRAFRRREGSAAERWHPIGPWGIEAGDPRAHAWYDHVQHPTSDLVGLLLAVSLLGRWLQRFGCRTGFALAEGWGRPPDADAVIARYARQIDPTWLVGGDLSTWPDTRLRREAGSVLSSAVHRAWAQRFLAPHFDT